MKQHLLVVFLSAATASASSPHLAAINPTGAQRGTQIEASFEGELLQDTEEVLCYEPGIQVLKLVSATKNVRNSDNPEEVRRRK